MERAKKMRYRDHHRREDLGGEHAAGDLGQLILLMIFLAVWISDTFFTHKSIWLTDRLPAAIRLPLGLFILLLSGALAGAGLWIIFGKVRESPRVVREGVFQWVRHPIYLAAMLYYLGLLVFSLSLFAAMVWVVIVAFYFYLSRHEEKLLIEKFGAEYQQYMREVPMFLPRLKKRT